jgi:protein-S-isoprenylcysteine O-methyltransferase Ste14
MLVAYPGIGLTFATRWTWIACGVMVLGYVLLTFYEDNSLAEKLPGYQEYQQRTRYRLVPGVW